MSILIDRDTPVMIQGITGRVGQFHCEQMLAYGTRVVAGVTPGRAGDDVLGVPVFNTVSEAVESSGATTYPSARHDKGEAIHAPLSRRSVHASVRPQLRRRNQPG